MSSQEDMRETMREFGKCVRALGEYGQQTVLTGGLVPYMYRYLLKLEESTTLPPLQTFDLDWTLPNPLDRTGDLLHERLVNSGFEAILERTKPHHIGRYQPANHGTTLSPIHIEFLTPRKGGAEVHGRNMAVPAVQQDLNAQALPYLDLLLHSTLPFDASVVPDCGLEPGTTVLLPGPMAFLLRKTLARSKRPPKKKASDQAHIYDTVVLWHNNWPAVRTEFETLAAASFPKAWFTRARNKLMSLYSSPNAGGPVEVVSIYKDSAGTPRLREKTVHRVMERFLKAVGWQ
jgi:hypothetical protein